MKKWTCEVCAWQGAAYLTAANPFDPEEIVTGCPACKGVNTIREACDVEGCWQPTTCGFPTDTGYRRTCGAHYPKEAK